MASKSNNTRVRVVLIAALLMGTAQLAVAGETSQNQSTKAGKVQSNHAELPLFFETNQGQTDPQVQFFSRGQGYSIFLTSRGIVLALRGSSTPTADNAVSPFSPGQHAVRPAMVQLEKKAQAAKAATALLDINLVGAAYASAVGEEPLPTKVNYFIGRDPKGWRRNIPTYAKVRYRNVYPGIDLVYYGNHGKVEYDFDLAPGADPAKIQFAIEGADSLAIADSGDLVIGKADSELRFQIPLLYQTIHGQRQQVSGTYILRDGNHVGFKVSHYDTRQHLIIDPVLVYSTYLGGSGDDFSNGIAVDSTGAAYVTGVTDSPDFALTLVGSTGPTGLRMFLAKLNPAGSSVVFADYFGGTNGDELATSVDVDSTGNAYVTGYTASSDFPVASAYQGSLAGTQDAFLTKFSADGASLMYSTYLGGSNAEIGYSVSVDPAGEAVVAGTTQSTDFPKLNAYQASISADQFGDWGVYGFLTKFTAPGTTPAYSTFLGGSHLNASACPGCFPDSEILQVATDASGNAYVTGYTNTTDFPVTVAAFSTTYPGLEVSDVGFVSAFDTLGTITYATFLSGQTSSFLNAITADSTGAAYVTGYDTADDGFPITNTTICDPSSVSCSGAIVAKLDSAGANLVYSTYLAATNEMVGQGIKVDGSGHAFIVGSALQFSLTNPIQPYSNNGDLVVAEVSSDGNTQVMSTFLGGQGFEAASGIALDRFGAVYVTGLTQSSDFPVTQTAAQRTLAGQSDIFIAKIDPATNAPAVSFTPVSVDFGSQLQNTPSAPQTVVLRNMGSAALTISSITMPNADFAETDDCAGSVAAASFCTFSITFTATSLGAETGSLQINDNASGSPHFVTLSGTGTAAASPLLLSPAALSFAASPVGSATDAQTITITNSGNWPVAVGSIQLTGDFATVSDQCGTLAANQACTVQVSFAPTSSGLRSGEFQLTDSLTGSSQVVALSGSGIDFVATPANGNTSVVPGSSATYQLTVGSLGGNFSNPVTFSCSGAPAFATCRVSPSTIVPGTASAVSVTVTTAGPAAPSSALAQSPWGSHLGLWVGAQFGIAGVFLLGRSNRRKIVALIMLMMLIVPMGLMVACSHGGATRSLTAHTTPAGTYTLTVTGRSGMAAHQTLLTLTVK